MAKQLRGQPSGKVEVRVGRFTVWPQCERASMAGKWKYGDIDDMPAQLESGRQNWPLISMVILLRGQPSGTVDDRGVRLTLWPYC